jgi:type II secretion system protein N
VAVPESLMIRFIEKKLSVRNISFATVGLSKGLFYSVNIDRVLVNKKDASLLIFQDVHVTPDFIALFTFKPRLRIQGKMNTGTVDGTIGREDGGISVTMSGRNIQTNGVPLLEYAGISGEGALSFQFQQTGKSGEVRLTIDNANLKGSLNGVPAVPLTAFNTVKGALLTGDAITTIRSLTMEGKGIYARLTGEFANNRLNGKIEIMADPSCELYSLLQVALKQYMASPGHYIIPVS